MASLYEKDASCSSSSPSVSARKLRRVSLPTSHPRPTLWTFRDEMGLQAVSPSPSADMASRGKEAVGTPSLNKSADQAKEVPGTKKQRKKWSMEETKMLVDGCNVWGVGNWKAILNDPQFKFENRSPVDLKDRFRTYFPDAYRHHYPNAKTHLSSRVRSALPDGSSIFGKTRSKRRRPFTAEEDEALRKGYEKHGTVWAVIVKDPIFQSRRSTDLRDRFRNAFPDLYQQAGYKPRPSRKNSKNTRGVENPSSDPGPSNPIDHPHTSSPAKASEFSVPTKDEMVMSFSISPKLKTDGICHFAVEELEQSKAHTFDAASSFQRDAPTEGEGQELVTSSDDVFSLPPATSHSPVLESSSESNVSLPVQRWSLEQQHWIPAGSPTSSHHSGADYFHLNPHSRRNEAIGKSAWGSHDWLSANPRLAHGPASSEFLDSWPLPSSAITQGVVDRYDLYSAVSAAHDFASEAGIGDSHSSFSEADLFASHSFRGFTHHHYAGDLIFGSGVAVHPPHLHSSTGSGVVGLGLHGIQEMQFPPQTLSREPSHNLNLDLTLQSLSTYEGSQHVETSDVVDIIPDTSLHTAKSTISTQLGSLSLSMPHHRTASPPEPPGPPTCNTTPLLRSSDLPSGANSLRSSSQPPSEHRQHNFSQLNPPKIPLIYPCDLSPQNFNSISPSITEPHSTAALDLHYYGHSNTLSPLVTDYAADALDLAAVVTPGVYSPRPGVSVPAHSPQSPHHRLQPNLTVVDGSVKRTHEKRRHRLSWGE